MDAATKMIVGLDIGTSRVVVIVAEVNFDGGLDIVGVGKQPSNGIKAGVVVDIDSTVSSIRRAIKQAEQMANCQIHSVYLGIDGTHIRSFNSHGMVGIYLDEVSIQDIYRVIDSAKAVALSTECNLIHVLAQEYAVDSHKGIKDPLGMSGVRLEANVHLVSCKENAKRNLENCVLKCGLHVEQLILEQLASSYSVLTEFEKDHGVCLVDLGAGSTDIAFFSDGAVRYTNVIPFAGKQITKDIATSLGISIQTAEKLKVESAGVCEVELDDENIKVHCEDYQVTKTIPQQMLLDIMESRCDELLNWVMLDLSRHGLHLSKITGVVLTGGSAKMKNIELLAAKVFNLPVRIGLPIGFNGMVEVINDPTYSTATGLLRYKLVQNQERFQQRRKAFCSEIWSKAKQWFKQKS